MRTAVLTALATLACLAVSLAPVFADDPPSQAGKGGSPVSPLLQQFIEQREGASGQGGQPSPSDAVTRSLSDGDVTSKYAAASATATSGSSDSQNNPVRFDSSGNVQVYIHLENTDDGYAAGTAGPGRDHRDHQLRRERGAGVGAHLRA